MDLNGPWYDYYHTDHATFSFMELARWHKLNALLYNFLDSQKLKLAGLWTDQFSCTHIHNMHTHRQ